MASLPGFQPCRNSQQGDPLPTQQHGQQRPQQPKPPGAAWQGQEAASESSGLPAPFFLWLLGTRLALAREQTPTHALGDIHHTNEVTS